MRLLLLLRHALTEQTGARLSGWTPGLHLSEAGREQAKALAERLGPVSIDALYTSPLERARQTAAIVAERVGLEPIADVRFAETETGEWTERRFDDIEPEAFAAWQRAGDGFRYPGGESLNEQMERVVDGLVAVTQRGDLPALIVCHRGTIRVALCHTQQRGLDVFSEIDVPNGGLVRL